MGARFADRHIGMSAADQEAMCAALGFANLDALIDAIVPEPIRERTPLDLPAARTESEVQRDLATYAQANTANVSMIGLGYSDTITPPVIRRNVLENPAWYTAYTPYQPEIAQGRLEALLNFQTMVCELTGMELANASLLDEATAAAEAMTLLHRLASTNTSVFVVDADCYPQTIEVVRTRAVPLGIEVVVADVMEPLPNDTFGVLCPYVGASGCVRPLAPIAAHVHEHGAQLAVTADLLALVALEAPGVCGADVVIGSTQRFGVPLGFGGPHAAYIATSERAKRVLPGRLVGVSLDAAGNPALRLTLQTREQHIRREKATSNICTAQALLAVVAAMYASYHGPEGLQAIADRVAGYTAALASVLSTHGVAVITDAGFDTITVNTPGRADTVCDAAGQAGINLRRVDADHVAVSCDEVTTPEILVGVAEAFGVHSAPGAFTESAAQTLVPDAARRRSPVLTHPVFMQYHSETEMLRYLRRLSDRDLALDRTMIPLGSCTMKLNATVEMEPISWSGFAQLHPFAPSDQTAGYRTLISELETWLAEITGYDAVSLQPNAGSQGEYAGLLAIRAYHASRGEPTRTVCLIPSSAHGTNAASAVMAGMDVVVVECDDHGNVDVDDCKVKAHQYADRLAALMITYPSTHGVFETSVRELCAIVHECGGQVYLDGANLNALVGVAKPGHFGADVSHLNLHKTFCIPHGGGGPGVGPIGVGAHLAPFLPNHPLVAEAGPATGVGPIAGAPWGSAGILPISWAYIALMGPDGLLAATKAAMLAANYVAHRVHDAFPILYRGERGLVAHECILDLRDITARTGVTVDDVAKRLMDYGFHAPTMSWPVAGTLMVEPTESESRAELDRFCDALLAIRAEIADIERGAVRYADSALAHAPHTAAAVVATEWNHPYSREQAALPVSGQATSKYWPPVARIDAAYGDRNVVCTCPPVSAYAEERPIAHGR
ncbi:MAG: aminomethyl-transferring glycine dehydrogenase [Acidimicrobiia bacterium]